MEKSVRLHKRPILRQRKLHLYTQERFSGRESLFFRQTDDSRAEKATFAGKNTILRQRKPFLKANGTFADGEPLFCLRLDDSPAENG